MSRSFQANDIARPSVVHDERRLPFTDKRTEQADRRTDGLSAFHAENNEVAFDSNLGNVVGENRHRRHTRSLLAGATICTLFSGLLPQNKSMLALSTFRPLAREFGWKLLALMLVISCALLPAVIWQMVFHPLWTVTQ